LLPSGEKDAFTPLTEAIEINASTQMHDHVCVDHLGRSKVNHLSLG